MSEPDEVLVDLAMHPGWEILEQRVKDHQERESRSFASALLRSAKPVDQLQVARARGFWAGQRWLLRQVRHDLTAYAVLNEKDEA